MFPKDKQREIKRQIKKGLVYLLISIPLSFLLMKVITEKYTTLFWTFMAVGGIAGLIAEFMDELKPSKELSPFMKIIRHILVIFCFTGMMCWLLFYLRGL